MPQREIRDFSDEEKNVEINRLAEERRVRKLDKSHGFVAQIQNIQYSRDDYEQEYQQKRKEREMIVAKEKEEKERKAKESEDVEHRGKRNQKKDHPTRADAVMHWGHDGFAEQQKKEELFKSARRPPRVLERNESRHVSKEGYHRNDEVFSIEKSPPVRKQVKLRPLSGPYIPPKRTEMTMASSPLTKQDSKFLVEKIKKGRGHSPGNSEHVDVDLSRLSLREGEKSTKHDTKHDGNFFEARHTRITVVQHPNENNRRSTTARESEQYPRRIEIPPRSEKHSSQRGEEGRGGTQRQPNCEICRSEELSYSHSWPSSDDERYCGDKSDQHSRRSEPGRYVHRDCTRDNYEPQERRRSHFSDSDERSTQCSHHCCVDKADSERRRDIVPREVKHYPRGEPRDDRHVQRQEICGREDDRYDTLVEHSCSEHSRQRDVERDSGSFQRNSCEFKVSESPACSVDSREKKKEKKKKRADSQKKKKKKIVKKDCEPCLIMKLDLGNGLHKDLKYYEGENPTDSALAFCEKYKFGGESFRQYADALALHIRENLLKTDA